MAIGQVSPGSGRDGPAAWAGRQGVVGSTGLAEGIRIWVREIILILFLAGALEMLLPETDTKRFARVAVGFFVVLAVGRPLLSVMGGGFIFDSNLAGLGSWELGLAPAGLVEPAGSPGSTAVERGTEMWQASRDRALAAARAALESQIAGLAEREPEVREASAAVDLESDPSSASYGAMEALTLRVWLAAGTGEEGAQGSRGGAGFGPESVEVEPIMVGEGGPAGAGTEDGSGSPSPGVSGGGGPLAVYSGRSGAADDSTAAGRLARRLGSELVLLFGIPPGGLTVEVWP